MRCPYCSSGDSRVVDSRIAPDGAEVRRRRECGECGGRFTSYERVAESLPRVVKRSGDRVPFDENRLRRGMQRACEKREVPSPVIEAAVGRIRQRLSDGGSRDVPSGRIGELVMAELQGLDWVAYLQFALVHRRFGNVAGFLAEVEALASRPQPGEPGDQLPLLPQDEAEDPDGGAGRNGNGAEDRDGGG